MDLLQQYNTKLESVPLADDIADPESKSQKVYHYLATDDYEEDKAEWLIARFGEIRRNSQSAKICYKLKI